ncbi:DUF3168 domain-containing protein [Rossellomorea sp. BNER]|uniref:DUF3168 domain-containing protein n=1 Tax=Rossellomorea sp. BNER TaxID=2962031 RepID=UPI003AF25953|nr:DUF3168 domain-containing protein [Rossellomorea sp. BNER]
MIETSLWSLQQAIVKRLSEDIALNEVVNGVYDEVPTERNEAGELIPVKFPYVTVGEPTTTPFETKTSFGEDVAIVLDCWSQYKGKKEVYDILNLMLKAIAKSPLELEGDFSLNEVKLHQMTVIRDIDNITRHGIMRWKFNINNGKG